MAKTYTGINIQYPISQLILNGSKTIETRTYPIPQEYVGAEMLLIETPGKTGRFKARIVGIIKFSGSFKYDSIKHFRADTDRHKVEKGTIWDWKPEKPKHGWIVEYIKPLPPKEFEGVKGIVYTRDITLS